MDLMVNALTERLRTASRLLVDHALDAAKRSSHSHSYDFICQLPLKSECIRRPQPAEHTHIDAIRGQPVPFNASEYAIGVNCLRMEIVREQDQNVTYRNRFINSITIN